MEISPQRYQQGGTGHCPYRFGEIERAQDDAHRRERSDDVDRLGACVIACKLLAAGFIER